MCSFRSILRIYVRRDAHLLFLDAYCILYLYHYYRKVLICISTIKKTKLIRNIYRKRYFAHLIHQLCLFIGVIEEYISSLLLYR